MLVCQVLHSEPLSCMYLLKQQWEGIFSLLEMKRKSDWVPPLPPQSGYARIFHEHIEGKN
jgi:hypothetical protein